MSRSSARRAQVEPLAALVAVAVLCLAVGAYGAVRADVLPAGDSDAPANAVLSETVDAATPQNSLVVDPQLLDAAAVPPPGYEATITVTTGNQTWRSGPDNPPADAASATRRVPVRVGPGSVRPGRVVVEVWS